MENPFRPASYQAAAARHQWTRFAVLRGMGFIYTVAFAIVLTQYRALVGERGLLPIALFQDRAVALLGSQSEAFWAAPSLFWLDSSDATLALFGWLGLLGSLAVLCGFANAPLMFFLWLVYGSFVHLGQTFYGFGWEMLLLEAGFLAVFLAHPVRLSPRDPSQPPLAVLWLYRWLAFRLLFGAGLIKLRGDDCWVELSCLVTHYETQPNPHPLSWLLHQAPPWLHSLGVLFNHFVELVVPFGLFGPRKLRHVAGSFAVAFQLMLIFSGNLSFLNWLSIVITLSCFDDGWFERVLPARWTNWLRADSPTAPPLARRAAVGLLCATVALLSLNPVANMLGPGQRMNASFDPLHLVNTYGAFGSVGKERLELVIEGTHADPEDPDARWLEYEFPCKPGRLDRLPCLVTPYHYRLDWQMWFAAMSRPERQPWLVHLVKKLLDGDPVAKSLLAHDPFATPPSYVRVSLYRYQFTTFGEPLVWKRERRGEWLPPLSKDDPRLTGFLRRHGLVE